jgi:hypothetical protein
MRTGDAELKNRKRAQRERFRVQTPPAKLQLAKFCRNYFVGGLEFRYPKNIPFECRFRKLPFDLQVKGNNRGSNRNEN